MKVLKVGEHVFVRHSNKEILEKALKKAIDGGWLGGVVELDYMNSLAVKTDDPTTQEIVEWVAQRVWMETLTSKIIFNHDFAKALWGGELPYGAGDYYYQGPDTNWEYNLQQMVISDDPIKYLGENI